MTTISQPGTQLCDHTNEAIFYRGRNLVEELLGRKTFIEVMFMQVMGRELDAHDLRVVDAVLVALMEHGMTPSAIATRLIYMSAPENLQGAVAAGLLGVGSQFIGTMENCALLIEELVASAASAPGGMDAAAHAIAERELASGRALPGFGHHMHKPDDPRAIKLIEIGFEHPGFAGSHLNALRALSQAVDALRGKHLTINATGAVAALLGELGVPARVMRGFAVLARAAGLVAHVAEEQGEPSARHIWELVDGQMTRHPR